MIDIKSKLKLELVDLLHLSGLVHGHNLDKQPGVHNTSPWNLRVGNKKRLRRRAEGARKGRRGWGGKGETQQGSSCFP